MSTLSSQGNEHREVSDPKLSLTGKLRKIMPASIDQNTDPTLERRLFHGHVGEDRRDLQMTRDGAYQVQFTASRPTGLRDYSKILRFMGLPKRIPYKQGSGLCICSSFEDFEYGSSADG